MQSDSGVSHKGHVPTYPINYRVSNLEGVKWPLAVPLWLFNQDTQLLKIMKLPPTSFDTSTSLSKFL